ncbi:MAG: RloB family protein [Rhodobacteraceae bacterium]|nr:RloB family protein [Paracoccaceae bacterium]
MKIKRRGKLPQDTKRRKAHLEELERALIITEGSKTEPDYFNRLIKELGLTSVQIYIYGEGDSAPISVVQNAENLLKRDPDFNHVYLVFDRDRHPTYNEALAKAKKIKPRNAPKGQIVQAIPSIPCFEIWYFFHVSDRRTPYHTGEGVGSPAQILISVLKKSHRCFEKYNKATCDDFYDEIKLMRGEACKRAEKFLKEAQKDGARCHHENPSTRVHLVVRKLQELAKLQE